MLSLSKTPFPICTVYTIGIRTSGYPPSEEERLKALGAEFYRTNRGGLITFHGPGQLVGYPILNLAYPGLKKSMKWYLCKLEETVIRTCTDAFGIPAGRSPDTGVWVGNDKICAMGIRSRIFEIEVINLMALHFKVSTGADTLLRTG